MDLKIWLKFVYFDSPVVDASSSAPEEKSSKQMSQKFYVNMNSKITWFGKRILGKL